MNRTSLSSSDSPFYALVLPGYSFTIGRELGSGVASRFEASALPWISVCGGYLGDGAHPDDDSSWIYSMLPRFGFRGVLLYGGGIAYRSGISALVPLIGRLGSTPLVNVSGVLPGHVSVNSNDYQGMYDLVSRLIEESGARTLAFVTGPRDNPEAEARFRGFSDALKAFSIELRKEWILEGDFTPPGGRRAVRALLDSDSGVPRILCCANDLSAFGALEYLLQKGLRIPQDIMVSGFDDFDHASTMKPSLSTVSFPIREMGREAARYLENLCSTSIEKEIANASGTESGGDPHIIVPSFPVFRESTGHPMGDGDMATIRSAFMSRLIAQERQPFRLQVTQLLLEEPRFRNAVSRLAPLLASAGIRGLMLVLFNHNPQIPDSLRLDGGFAYPEGEAPLLIQTDRDLTHDSHLPLPPELLDILVKCGGRLMLVPLQHGRQPQGYMILSAEESALDYPEILALQLSGYLYRWSLQREAEKRATELAEMVDELTRARKEAGKVERLRDLTRLIAGLGHELNTPIGSSFTLASFLHERSQEEIEQRRQQPQAPHQTPEEAPRSPATADHFLDQVALAAESLIQNLSRATGLLATFRSLIKDPSEQRLLRFRLGEFIDYSLQRFLNHPERSMELISNCPAGLEIVSDPDALEMILEQLMHNAIAHAYEDAERGVVQIDIRQEGSQVHLHFRDFGSAPEELDLERIFDPFYTTRRAAGHVGLGLHIAYNLVHYQLGGSLRVRRNSRGGLTFILMIPAQRISSGAAAAAAG